MSIAKISICTKYSGKPQNIALNNHSTGVSQYPQTENVPSKIRIRKKAINWSQGLSLWIISIHKKNTGQWI